MMYIEVSYLNKMQYASRKLQAYDDKEIETMYNRTIGKMQSENKSVLICLRSDDHVLIKSELLK